MNKVAHVRQADSASSAAAPPFIGHGHKKNEIDDIAVQMLKLSPAIARLTDAISDLSDTGGQFMAAAYSVPTKRLAAVMHSKPGFVRFAYDALVRANGDTTRGSQAKQMKISPSGVEFSPIAASGRALATEVLNALKADLQAQTGQPDPAERAQLERNLKQVIASMLAGSGAKVYRFREKSENESFAAGILAIDAAKGEIRVLSSL